MDINFLFSRKRREFGKPCAFIDIGPKLIIDIDQNLDVANAYQTILTVDREADNSMRKCAYEVNTESHPTENRGMKHMEGGWPASVDNEDDDSMARFRKKVEKDKSYVNTVKSLADFVETFIMENNSIDVYEDYFADEKIEKDRDFSLKNMSVFTDPAGDYRSVVDVSWTLDSARFAAAYALNSSKEVQLDAKLDCFVWDAQNPVSPICTLLPEVGVCCVQCSPTDVNVLVSGSVTGQVALWDIRTSGRSQKLSDVLKGHKQAVTGIKWLVGKQDMTFFSSSNDGRLITWDIRNLSSPLEVITLADSCGGIPGIDQSYSVSCAEYDATVPDQFMLGTDQGVVLAFNRKADNNDKLRAKYQCGGGPLLCVERNAFFPQLFATCNSMCVKLWSEAAVNYPILDIVTSDGYFTDITWSPTRSSCLYAAKTTGVLEIWDVPGKNKGPLVKVRVCDDCIFKVSSSPSGKLIACGSTSGSLMLLTVPDYLRRSSDIENDLVKACVKESKEVIGGKPRSERAVKIEEEIKPSIIEEYDLPEKPEDLAEESGLAPIDLESVSRLTSEEAVDGEAYVLDIVKSEDSLEVRKSMSGPIVSDDILSMADDASEVASIVHELVDDTAQYDSTQYGIEDGAVKGEDEDDVSKDDASTGVADSSSASDVEDGVTSDAVEDGVTTDAVDDGATIDGVQDTAAKAEVEEGVATSKIEDGAPTGEVQDDETIDETQNVDTKAEVEDEATTEVQDGEPTGEVKDEAATDEVQDDATTGEIQEVVAKTEEEDNAALCKIEDGEPTGEVQDDATTGEVQDDATTGEVQDDATTGEVQDDATTGEAQDDAATGEVQDDATTGEVQEDATTGGVQDDALTGECQDDATTGEVQAETTEGEAQDNATPSEVQDDATTDGVQNDATTGVVQDDATTGECQDDATTGEVQAETTEGEAQDNATPSEVQDDATTAQVEDGATTENDEGTTADKKGESAVTGEVKENATAGEVEDAGTTDEVTGSATSGEIEDDATQNEVEDNVTQKEGDDA